MNDFSSCEEFIFQNPEQKPLEELKLLIKINGISQTIPALDKYWVEKRSFLHYETPNLVDEDGKNIIGAKERWLELASFILDDLIWLLRLPFHKFWSNIIHNPSIMDSIITFLQEAPTPYTLGNFSNDYNLKEHFDQIRHHILIIFARLVTNKESPVEYISLSYHAHLLYDKYIFTIPILMDLCQQYGYDNKKIVEKIVNTVFTLQSLYEDDLDKAVSFIIQALVNIEKRFEDCLSNQNRKAVSFLERERENGEITLLSLEDMILYLIDMVSTINIFIDIYLPAVDIFKTENFITRIITVYTSTIPEMYKRLDNLAYKDEIIAKYIELKNFLDVSRVEILNIYRKIIYSSIEKISERRNDSISEIGNIVEDFLTNLMLTLSEKEFVIDYQNLYPVTDDFQTILEIYPDLDTVKCEFIINSIFTSMDEPVNLPNVATIKKNSEILPQDTSNKILKLENEVNMGGPSTTNCKTEIDSLALIFEVKDIFCDLGEGFIEQCLKHYNYNKEAVINAVLEDTLPVELKSLDRTLPLIPADPEEASATVDAAIGIERLNIYDNDEFDIMTKDVIDTSRIHKGKRQDKYKNLNQLLNDKTHLMQTKEIYNKYSIVTSEYDDEYDDTYDDRDIGASTQDDILEVDARPFTIPRVLRKQEANEIDEIEDDDFQDTLENQGNKNNFAQDPALLRAKAEERRKSKQGIRTFQSPNKSVVGNPKGQGQSKEVTDNRNQKNKQKAARANHNRRSGSQWKRNQGMVPS